MTDTLAAERAALRRRQGAGARYDAPGAPARELDWARRGTAYFARLLNDLGDAALDAPSAIPGLSRRHVVAHIGYHARIMSEMVAWVRAGRAGPFEGRFLVPPDAVALGVTLPSHALRHLFDHSRVHLDVEWRDLAQAGWNASLTDAAGRSIQMRDTPKARARAIWLHAIDLEAGGRLADLPAEFRDALAGGARAGTGLIEP